MARKLEIIEGLDTDASTGSLLKPFRLKRKKFHNNIFNIKPIRSSDFATPEILAEAEERFLELRYEKYALKKTKKAYLQPDFFKENLKIKHLKHATHDEVLESQNDFIKTKVKSLVFKEDVFSCTISYPKVGHEDTFESFESIEDLIDYVQLIGHGKRTDLSRGRKSNTKWITPDGITVKVEGCTYNNVWS
jgi:hypothetical protein